ncbi:MAG: carbohydrate-binding domain-containing protein [Clostridiales bacterium]|nr:carbohydrate-binding domain-containing protein [Clostridiales bacterium]
MGKNKGKEGDCKMKKKQSWMMLVLSLALLASGCSSPNNSGTSGEQTNQKSGEESKVQSDSGSDFPFGDQASDEDGSGNLSAAYPTDFFSDRDFEVGYDENTSAVIRLNGDSASCTSDAVQISGSTVTILDEGTYILSGTLDDGMIIVNAEKTDKIQLVLDGVSIHSETSAPIYILQSDKVFVTMAEGSENTLTNGGTFTAIDENNIDAVIFSKEDVTFNGMGTLTVTSPGGHGIVSKDSLTFTSGTYDINCASHALSGKDDVTIANAEFILVSGKDGIHSENGDDAESGYVYIQSGTFQISAEGDGISASYFLQIADGTFDITSGGGSENASARSSDSWGNFMGGGRHSGGGKRGAADGAVPPESKNGEKSGGAESPESSGGVNGVNYTGTEDNSGRYAVNQIPGTLTAAGTTDAADTTEDSSSMKGLKAAADLIIGGGTFTINSADDGVHSNSSLIINGGVFEMKSGDDGFHADENLNFTEGTVNLTESYEGMEGLYIHISGGTITLTASDDGLNAAGGNDSSGMTGGRDGMFGGGNASSNGSILISGGTICVTASGDGIDANGSLEITGGDTIVSGPAQGDTSTLDYDTTAVISGGTFIGTGASGMAQTFSDSEQGVVAVSVGSQSAGTEITLADQDGNIIITHTPEIDFAVAIISSPELVKGETYMFTVGSLSGEFTAN